MTAAAADAGVKLIPRAIEVFARGFAFTRSLTHPYLAERIGPLWVVRDAPRKNAANYRREEYIAWNVSAAEVKRLARQHTRGRYAICAMLTTGESDAELRAGYQEANFRLAATEPVMVQPLHHIPRLLPPAGISVERVLSQELADRLNKATRTRQVLPEHLREHAPLRQYAALDGERVVGWVRSITVKSDTAGHCTWCSNMGVTPAYRRRGIARALLSRTLHDDKAAGATLAVLTSSHTGALLYPHLGYQQIATLYLYNPRR